MNDDLQQLLTQLPIGNPSGDPTQLAAMAPPQADNPGTTTLEPPSSATGDPLLDALNLGGVKRREAPINAAAAPAQPPGQTKGQFFKNMLSDFLYSFGKGLEVSGSGPGANARGAGGALTALPERDVARQHMALQQQQADSIEALRRAQEQKNQQDSTPIEVQDANGKKITLPAHIAVQIIGKGYTLAGQKAAIAGKAATTTQTLESQETRANAANATKERIAQMSTQQKQQLGAKVLVNQGIPYAYKSASGVTVTDPEDPRLTPDERAIFNNALQSHRQAFAEGIQKQTIASGNALNNALTMADARDIMAQNKDIRKNTELNGDLQQKYATMQGFSKLDNPASNYAMLINFIGATLSAQRGARINKSEIERAATTRSLPDVLQNAYDLWISKKLLTPQQKQNMLDSVNVLLTESNNRVKTAGPPKSVREAIKPTSSDPVRRVIDLTKK